MELQDEAVMRSAEGRGKKMEARVAVQGISAYGRRPSQRPGMRAMVEYVLSQNCQAVFFYDESRVTRQVTDFVSEVWEEFGARKPEVKFYSASLTDDQEWDPEELQTQLRLVLASEDSAIKSRRAVDSQRMLLNRDRRKRPGFRVPFGFEMIDGILVQNGNVAIVYFIFFLASWGYGDENLAEILNHASVPSPSGAEWNASSIDLIVNHKAHLGHLSWNVRKSAGNSARKPDHQISLFENVYEPIIPSYLWEMVQGLRRLKKETGLKFSTPNFLDGIARCKSCNVLLKAKDQSPSSAKGKYVRYQCPKCGKKASAHDLHKVVYERVVRDWGGTEQASKLEAKARPLLNQWQRLLGRERKSLLESRERATLGLHSGDLSADLERSFRVALNHIEDRRRSILELENRVAALPPDPDLLPSLGRFGFRVFQPLFDVERRTFLLAVVDSIQVAFGSPIRIIMEYRLSPYVSMESEIGRLTESSDELMGKKPKAQ